jgi:hypothetical protein
MVPLDRWDPDDRAEMNALLDLADSNNKERSGQRVAGGLRRPASNFLGK